MSTILLYALRTTLLRAVKALMLNSTGSETSFDICNRNGVVYQWTQMEIHAMYVYYALQYLRGQHAEHLLLYFQLRPFIAFFGTYSRTC